MGKTINAQRQPTRNTATKKRADQEELDSDYLVDNSSTRSARPLVGAEMLRMNRRFDLSTILKGAVERMFTADEVSGVVDLAKLQELKHRVVNLFLYSYDARRNREN